MLRKTDLDGISSLAQNLNKKVIFLTKGFNVLIFIKKLLNGIYNNNFAEVINERIHYRNPF